MPVGLVGSFSRDHRGDGFQENREVGLETPVFYILHIQPHPLIEAQLAPTRNLPETGYPGRNFEPPEVPGLIVFYFAGQRRTRPHNAHVAANDIEDLWDFVETRPP